MRQAAACGGQVELSIAEAERDFVDVRDVARACVLAAGARVTGRAINIGSGSAVPLRTLVRLFVTAAGLPTTMIKERAEAVPSLGTDWALADVRLAGELLHWRPDIELPESLRAMWEAEREERC